MENKQLALMIFKYTIYLNDNNKDNPNNFINFNE